MSKIETGKDLINVFNGSLAFLFSNDEPETEDDLELISSFIQNVQDWCDIWGDIESGSQVKAQFYLTQEIKQLAEIDFSVFAIKQKRHIKI